MTRKLQVGKALSCPAGPLFSYFLVARGMDVPAGLKVGRGNLYQDAATLCAAFPAAEGSYGSRWRQVNVPVRGVRSQETWRVRGQLDGKDDKPIGEWIWVTTLPQQPGAQSPSATCVGMAFNEVINGRRADRSSRCDSSQSIQRAAGS